MWSNYWSHFFCLFNLFCLSLHVLLGYEWTEGSVLCLKGSLSIRNVFIIKSLSLRACDRRGEAVNRNNVPLQRNRLTMTAKDLIASLKRVEEGTRLSAPDRFRRIQTINPTTWTPRHVTFATCALSTRSGGCSTTIRQLRLTKSIWQMRLPKVSWLVIWQTRLPKFIPMIIWQLRLPKPTTPWRRFFWQVFPSQPSSALASRTTHSSRKHYDYDYSKEILQKLTKRKIVKIEEQEHEGDTFKCLVWGDKHKE